MKKCDCCNTVSQEHGHSHEHSQSAPACTEGCCGGNEARREEISSPKQDVIALILSGAMAVAALLAPDGILKTALLAAATLIAGLPIFWQGIKNILKFDLEEMALMTIAVVAAAVIGELPEGLLVTLLFRAGELLEDIAVSRSRREVEAITKIIPDNANLVLADGSSRSVSAKTLEIGSRILIKSGERIPVDCVVLSGDSSVDSSSITGESVAREVHGGDVLLSGMVNVGGVLTCETTSTFDNSTASKIVEMVKESAAKKGTTEKLISKFARVYTPIVIVVSVAVAVLPPLLGFGTFALWIGRALVFLVASCPCALVIATPLAFFAGIGACSKNGILVKGSKYIEALAKTNSVVLDKTGTLTTGKLTVDEVFTSAGSTKEDVLTLAAICESYSNHPIAQAIVAAHGTPDTSCVDSCEEITSYGLHAQLGGDSVLCGSARLMERFGVDISTLPAANVYVAKNGHVMGAISVFDSPRPDAAQTVSQLTAMGISHVAMLTGDSQTAADKTGALVGITEVNAQLLPQDKVSLFEKIKAASNGTTLFVGDGINDSPVLAMADAGIAMGLASDAAIEAADVVLLSDKLASLPQVIRIARRVSALARVNITLALAIKMIVLILAFFGMASMWMAVFADVGVTILSVLNATRALRFR